ncbi:MAG: lipocalin family protein [Chloracidobacterium sp.]|nr:lipocalin family protein [Chloracidobacterium sp.]
MKKIVNYALIAAAVMVIWAVPAFSQTPAKLEAVRGLDLNKYLGKWYEIAKYPNKFQKQCAGNTTATYSLKPNGRIEVLNECTKRDGTRDSAKGEAKIPDKANNAKLKVRFAPSALSFLPFVWANYWVVALGPNYEYALIGEPDRKYFWILSRKPEMSDAEYQNLLRRAESLGFVPSKVEKTPQNLEVIPGGVVEK